MSLHLDQSTTMLTTLWSPLPSGCSSCHMQLRTKAGKSSAAKTQATQTHHCGYSGYGGYGDMKKQKNHLKYIHSFSTRCAVYKVEPRLPAAIITAIELGITAMIKHIPKYVKGSSPKASIIVLASTHWRSNPNF